MKYIEIPKFTSYGDYRVNVPLDHLEENLEHYFKTGLELEPDFQRGHVWNEKQQVSFVEFFLRGGITGREILFNCVGWMNDFRGPFVLVDGLQRLTALRKFLRDELLVFSTKHSEMGRINSLETTLIFCVNNLKTRKEVLIWYIELNSGGVVHTEEELNRVRELLEKEKLKEK